MTAQIGTWRLSNHKMTVRVKTDANHKIIDAADIVRKFKGQHIERLVRWMQRMGTTDVMYLKTEAAETVREA